MTLVGARPAAELAGLDEFPGKSNYFLGNDPQQWHTSVRTYARVRYQEAYPGIDLIYYGQRRQLEYDFVVAPGAEPSTIRVRLDGAQKLRVDRNGDLVFEVERAELRLHKPVVYQTAQPESASAKQFVEGRYLLNGEHEVGFEVAAYDRRQPLIIDPALSYATYLGGSGDDFGTGIAVDSAGNAYVAGYTSSADFPIANPLQPTNHGGADVFVAALDPTGSTLLYSTYLGGGSTDYGSGIAVDSAGNAYVTGQTFSTDFPTANPLQPTNHGLGDAFVAALDPTGATLLYSSYLGGSGIDYGAGIAVDSAGNAYVTGNTYSTDFPTANPLQPTNHGGYDAFVAVLDPTGATLRYSTYLGGSGIDVGNGIAVDSAGNAYVTGDTYSTDFPTASPLQPMIAGQDDAFVSVLDPTGATLLYSTYLGGLSNDGGFAIAVDSASNAYVTGYTASTNFPTVNPVQPMNHGDPYNAFVTAVDPTGSTLLYSTYLGGSAYDFARGIAVDSAGDAYVTGYTNSTEFPTANPVQPTNHGGYDAFVAAFDPTGATLLYATYLGGSNDEGGFGSALIGGGIAVDSAGNAYVTGYTQSPNFPTANPLQPTHGGGFDDAFVAKIVP
jgi:hypothetical protein